MNHSRKVAVLSSARVPFTKSFTSYANFKTQELMSASLKALVKKAGLEKLKIDDVALGAVITHPADYNLARECVLDTELSPATPAYNVQRACGTSMETAWQIGLKISAGQIDVGIAGGVDTNSDAPAVYPRSLTRKLMQLNQKRSVQEKLLYALSSLRPSDIGLLFPAVQEPRTKLSMGEHTEKMVKEWSIGRREQDELALKSHLNAAKAYEEGFFNDLVFPFGNLSKDPLVRGDTSLEKLAKLKPAFDRSEKGTLTAGNSTALTDGSSAVLLGSESWAKSHGHRPLAFIKDVQVSAVDFVAGAGLLMAPTLAVAKLLERNNLNFKDFTHFEIHEAFSGQVLCTLKAWDTDEFCRKELGLAGKLGELDRSRMNLKGGSVALGHPFAATGGRILGQLAKQLDLAGGGLGLISICTAGGMGIAAIVER